MTFSAPYLYTEQSVLTLKGYPKVSALEDLKGREVCTLSASTSQAAPTGAEAIVRRKNRISECIDDLRAGKVDAVSTDAAILAGFKARSPGEFEHWDLGLDNTEAWGVNVGENEALQDAGRPDPVPVAQGSRGRPLGESPTSATSRPSSRPTGPTPIAQAQQPDVAEAGREGTALGDGGPVTDIYVKDGGIAPRRRRAQLNWLLTVLPAFPLVLLVLRLWYLSRQDLPTMLLLVQYISPLGMISALFITLIWTVPGGDPGAARARRHPAGQRPARRPAGRCWR